MGLLRWAAIIGTGGLAPVKGTAPRERTAKAAEKQVRLQQQMLNGASRQAAPSPRATAARPAGSQPSKPLGWTGATIISLALVLFGGLAALGAASSGEGGVAVAFGIAFAVLIFVLLRKAYLNEQQAQQVPPPVGSTQTRIVPSQPPSAALETQGARATSAAAQARGQALAAGATSVEAQAAATHAAGVIYRRSNRETATKVAGADNVSGELGRLADLHERGALTDKEFAAAKAKALGTLGSNQ